MFAFLAACTSGCTRNAGDGVVQGCKDPAVLAKRRLLLADADCADDDEDAPVEGWLKKSSSFKMTRWLWQSRYFRLEHGPRLLSFYRSHIWQGCRRDGAYDLTCLVGAHVDLQRGGRKVLLVLELIQLAAEVLTQTEPVERISLLVPCGLDVARRWENHLRHCIEQQLLEACERCIASEVAVDRAIQILGHARNVTMEGRASVNVNLRKECSGQTPLMLTAEAGHERLCQQLLMSRADPDLIDDQGRSALDWANAEGHDKVAKLLADGIHASDHASEQSKMGRLGRARVATPIKEATTLGKLPTPARI